MQCRACWSFSQHTPTSPTSVQRRAPSYMVGTTACSSASASLCGHCTGFLSPIGFVSKSLLMHAVNNGANPAYIADTTSPISSLSRHRRLRYTAKTTTTTRYLVLGPSLVIGRSLLPDNGNGTISLRTSGTSVMIHFLKAPLIHTFID